MVAVLVVPSLLVGLVVAMFQAATQINEQTLSFLPRLLVMLITLIVAGPWLVQKFMEYITTLYSAAVDARMLEIRHLGRHLHPAVVQGDGGVMTMPIFGTRMLPARVRLYVAVAITVVIVPALPPLPEFDPLSLRGCCCAPNRSSSGRCSAWRCSCCSRRS